MNNLDLRPPSRAAACDVCKRTFDPVAWETLHVVERLRHDQLRDLLTEWPWSREAFLEVRHCLCGASISRLER